MKRITSILLVITLSISLAACGSHTKETEGETETVFHTEAAEAAEPEGEADSKEVVMQEPYKVVEAEVGQPIQVDAKYGSYWVTITGAEEVDWWQRKHGTNVKHVVLIHYEVENLNFSSILSDGVLLNPDSFRVVGDNDYTGKAFSTYYDGYEQAGSVKPGEKLSGTMAYEIDNPSRMPEYYNVVFKNSSGDIAKVRVDL